MVCFRRLDRALYNKELKYLKMEHKAKKKGKLIIISGPSGVGKSSLTDDALKDLEGFERSVSVTTRPRRKNEADGHKYNFISKQDFDNLIKEDKLLECAEYCDFQYGTPLDFVEKKLNQGKNVILEIEVQRCNAGKEENQGCLPYFYCHFKYFRFEKKTQKKGY